MEAPPPSGKELARLAAPIVATMWANTARTAVDKGDKAENDMIGRAIALAKKLHIAAHQQADTPPAGGQGDAKLLPL